MIVFAVVAGIFCVVQAMWARRLLKEGKAPRALRWFPWSIVIAWLAGALYCWWQIARSVDAMQTAKAGIERQTLVHAHVAAAQHACMYLTILVIVGGFVLMMVTKRLKLAPPEGATLKRKRS